MPLSKYEEVDLGQLSSVRFREARERLRLLKDYPLIKQKATRKSAMVFFGAGAVLFGTLWKMACSTFLPERSSIQTI